MRYNTGVANEINSRSGAGNTLRLDTRKAILMHPHFNRATGAAQASPVNKTSKRPRKRTIDDYRSIGSARHIEWIGGVCPRQIGESTLWRCLVCGHEWSTSFHNIKNGTGCKACFVEAQRIKEDAYVALAQERGFKYLGGYSGTVLRPVGWECSHGHQWQATFASVQSGRGCRACSTSRQRTEDEYIAAAQERGLVYVGGYSGNVKEKVQWKCSLGHEFWTSYDKIVNRGQGCGICSPTRKKSEGEYHQLGIERGFVYLGGYCGNVREPVEWQCKYGHTWLARYDNIRSGKGCPICGESLGEKEIASVLCQMGIPFEREKRFDSCRLQKPLPFDFSFELDGRKYLCEYDGRQHYEALDYLGGAKALQITKKRDGAKTEWAARNGYILIRVPSVVNIRDFLVGKIYHGA